MARKTSVSNTLKSSEKRNFIEFYGTNPRDYVTAQDIREIYESAVQEAKGGNSRMQRFILQHYGLHAPFDIKVPDTVDEYPAFIGNLMQVLAAGKVDNEVYDRLMQGTQKLLDFFTRNEALAIIKEHSGK